VWTSVRAGEIRQAVMRVAPYAQTSIDHALELVDAYATRWRSSWEDTCRAEVSDAGFDLRVACLEQRLHALVTVADALRASDRASARSVLDVVTGLPTIEHCDDLASLRKIPPPPPRIAAQIATLEREVVGGETRGRASRYKEADAILRRTQREAEALGYPAAQAHAELGLASLLMWQAHFTEAKPHIEAALNHAIAASDDEATARSYIMLASAMVALADGPRARELAATADASLRRIGDPPGLRARLTVIDATLPALSGDYKETLVRVTRAIPKLEAARYRREAFSLYRMNSALLVALGRIDEAHANYDREVDAYRELVGTAHPDYGEAVVARGSFLMGHELYAAAIADYQLGYKAFVDALGPDHSLTIKAGAETANADLLFGRYDEAIAKLRRAVDALETTAGPQGSATAHRDLGEALAMAGRDDEAERELDRALELDRSIEGPYHFADELDLAKLRVRQRRTEEAQAMLDRVRPEMIKLLGETNPAMSDIWILQARLDVARGQFVKAKEQVAKVTSGPNLAEANIVLAQALAGLHDTAGVDTARKVALALLDKIGSGARPDLRAELAAIR
jgi:tetratricopeptide (TPR) repeat protein